MMTAPCFLGCRSSRGSVGASATVGASLLASVRDSAWGSVTLRTSREMLPLETVSLRVPLESLRSLPSGASYGDASGRLRLRLGRDASTGDVLVWAESDSVGRLTEVLTEVRGGGRQASAATAAARSSETTRPAKGAKGLKWWQVVAGLAMAAVAAMVAGLSWKRVRNGLENH